MEAAAIVLCGGRSRRMGRDKASLPFGEGTTLLEHTVGIMRGCASEIVVVAREGQELAAGDYKIARDPAEGLGPLAGLAAGLAAIESERAFVTSCDAPLLLPEFVSWLVEQSQGHDAAVPFVDGYHMVLAAVYSRSVLPVAQRLLDEDRLRPLFLIQAVDARIVSADEVRKVDPDLDSFVNCNTPESYEAALRKAFP